MKKTIIAFFVIILITVIILFGIKSCNPRKKIISSEEEEYSAFINANIEFICELGQKTELKSDLESAKKRLNEIYEQYKLPVDDDTAMLTILKKYENNEEVIEIIKSNTAACQTGDNPIYFSKE